ncbi:MAG: hypothetical protein K0R77_767 [Chryseobacterium sp.]|jgi:magnesium-transporting ATPase (P-type)|uniref:hypothetical protein n=1 Tax=Chryseobacterium sp. TaxID=1871047 RepID=UPI002607DAB8|nr:hypothetical protein [Chryseobacterium sp.]MDF2551492.1 hypothetical protein [Chryseobacterium sp.]
MILKNFKNTIKSLKTDVNGVEKKLTLKYFIFLCIIPLSSFAIVYCNLGKKLIDNPSIFANLLSLFIGLIFGVLMKIPDKLGDLKIKEDDSLENQNKKNQAFNFLVSFRDFLTFSIVLAIFIIILIVLNNFFPGLTSINVEEYYTKINCFEITKISTYLIIILIFRFILVWGILSFIFYLILTISNLYEFILYEFKKNY